MDAEDSRNKLAGFDHRSKVALCLILLPALAPRLYGVDFGLPYLYHPDEAVHVEVALKMLKEGNPNPHCFRKPSFEIYLMCFARIPHFVVNGLGEGLSRLAHYVPTVAALG